MGKLWKRTYPDSSYEEFSYGCCDVETERARTGAVTTYVRDAAGRITKMTEASGTVTTYTYDQNGNTLSNGTVNYTWLGEELLSVTDGGSTYYPAIDGNKNVTAYVDNSGNKVADYTYAPFGKILEKSGTKADDFVFKFNSEVFDNETGLVYYNYRYYSPSLGRWLSRDPIQERGGYNLYGMVGNDPVNAWDYLGLDRLIMKAMFKCECCEIKLVRARATFQEDQFNILWLNPDYDVDIPGKFEFRKDGLFYNSDGNIITAGELAKMAIDGGAQSYDEWKKKIKKLANKNAINNGFTRYIDRLHEEGSSMTKYAKAKQREKGSEVLDATVSNLFWGVITGPLGAAGKAGTIISVADLARSYISAMLGTSATTPNQANKCKDQKDLASKLKKAGFYDIKTFGNKYISGKYELLDDGRY